MSFRRLSSILTEATFYYCPIICTELGRENISEHCPAVTISPAHFLPPQYSALSEESLIWPPQLRSLARGFLEKASARAGVPLEKWRGFNDLALVMAFEHGVPDATLPII